MFPNRPRRTRCILAGLAGCLIWLLSGPSRLPAQSERPEYRFPTEPGMVALLGADRWLYLEAVARSGEDLASLARRLCGSETAAARIARIHEISALEAGRPYRIPLANLTPVHQLRLLAALFPEDRLHPWGWEHRVTLEIEPLGYIARWLTGSGRNYPRLQEENRLETLVIQPGQVLRVPAELLLPGLRRALPANDGVPAGISPRERAAQLDLPATGAGPSAASPPPVPPEPSDAPPEAPELEAPEPETPEPEAPEPEAPEPDPTSEPDPVSEPAEPERPQDEPTPATPPDDAPLRRWVCPKTACWSA